MGMRHARERRLISCALCLAMTAGLATAQNRTNNNAAVAAARGQVQRAQQLLNVAQLRVEATWKADPNYLATVKEQEEARRAFNIERDRVIDSLRGNPEVADMKKSFDEADVDVREAQQSASATQPNARPDTLAPTTAQVSAAQDKLNHKMQLRKVVTDAILADPAAARAKARLDKANVEMQAMTLQHKAVLLNDPDYKSALDQLTQARAQLTEAAGNNNP